ncbi:hypothetical protein CXB51_031645 [Gossypium anomalum]|uniref:Reverse transcriptase Ty1/copia-type domain-containing protein n=1 Tax=Gossypium anomalum TaxID=47600 RepID=A0A8J5XRH7_9ROSI|nr:hypothetical protein CXB51_031645 [Gossypium anomalum]
MISSDKTKRSLCDNKDTESRKSQRVRKVKDFSPDFISLQSLAFLVEGNRESVIRKIPIMFNVDGDPKSYGEAMTSRDAAFWKEEINDEMDLILSNNTLFLVDLPQGSKPIRCKWVFKRKNTPTRGSPTFKARLVATGFRQKEYPNYFETYVPVARMTSIRILMALASTHKLHTHQMDGKTTFLNGDLEEEVYMEQPESFMLLGNEHKVFKLINSLYVLKQVPKQWHEKFDLVILSYVFLHNGADKCIYTKFTDKYGVIIYLYVDDLLIVDMNMEGVHETKEYLALNFKMKGLNELSENNGRSIAQLEEASAIGSLIDYLAILKGYPNASLITSLNDNKSTPGWIFNIEGGAISWDSKKQTCISNSTMEAKFITLTTTGKETK